jgi:hypothetical protein
VTTYDCFWPGCLDATMTDKHLCIAWLRLYDCCICIIKRIADDFDQTRGAQDSLGGSEDFFSIARHGANLGHS